MPGDISQADFRRILSGVIDHNQDEVAIYNDSETNQLDVESVDEKPLEGEDDPILKKLQFIENRVERVRLCLFYGANRSCAVFGGENAALIELKLCDDVFDKINSEADFFRLSEMVRKDVKTALDI